MLRDRLAPSVIEVVSRLQQAGHETYIVGGAVRDLLVGVRPKDFDIATSATPGQIKQVFGRRARAIGRRFRLVHVYHHDRIFEVSTFRREPTLEERRGRPDDAGLIVWCDNQYGTLEDDARRRDFTVNALYYDPCSESRELVDLVGGLKDLEARLVRAIGEPGVRLAEDPVRMLRACKLVGQYGFTLEPQLAASLRASVSQLELSSRARLLDELCKIFQKPFMFPIFACCHEVGLLHYLVPALGPLWPTPPGVFVQDLLRTRDALLSAGTIYPSRITAMVSLVLPLLTAAHGDQADGRGLWENFERIDKQVQHQVREFFQPYLIPRYSVAKARDVLLLLPKLLRGRLRQRIMHHPEYGRARDLFCTYVRAVGLDPELAAQWPRFEPHRQHRGP